MAEITSGSDICGGWALVVDDVAKSIGKQWNIKLLYILSGIHQGVPIYTNTYDILQEKKNKNKSLDEILRLDLQERSHLVI